MGRVLAFLALVVFSFQSYAGAPLKLSDGEAVVRYSAGSRAQVAVSVLNDLGRELILKSYSKP